MKGIFTVRFKLCPEHTYLRGWKKFYIFMFSDRSMVENRSVEKYLCSYMVYTYKHMCVHMGEYVCNIS